MDIVDLKEEERLTLQVAGFRQLIDEDDVTERKILNYIRQERSRTSF